MVNCLAQLRRITDNNNVKLGGDWMGCPPAEAALHCTKCTTHRPRASVPITILFYNGPLLLCETTAVI